MKTPIYVTVTLLLVCGAYAVKEAFSGTQEIRHAGTERPVVHSGRAPDFGTHQQQPTAASWQLSPFVKGQPRAVKSAVERAAERLIQMQQGGYETPARYFSMPLAQLQQLAKDGDVNAMLQLGQQYWDESAAIEREAGYDFSDAPKAIARKYMEQAAYSGVNRATVVLASRAAAEDPVDAYGWVLFARKLGENGADVIATAIEPGLTAQQRQQAHALAMAREQELIASWTVKRREILGLPQ